MKTDTHKKSVIREESLGARLKRLRLLRRLSIKETARSVGVPVTTYREWEYGRAIKGEPYVRIAEALDVSIAELLTGRGGSKTNVLKQLALTEKNIATLKRELESFF